jgi:hypothetical protein
MQIKLTLYCTACYAQAGNIETGRRRVAAPFPREVVAEPAGVFLATNVV